METTTTRFQRPEKLKSKSIKKETGCGHLYITLSIENERIVEVFADIGKAGGCSNCQNASLCRSVSIGLQFGIPVSYYIKTLKGMRCPSALPGDPEVVALSCADALAKVLEGETNGQKGKNT